MAVARISRREGPDSAAASVAIEIGSRQAGILLAAIDVATDDDAVAILMPVGRNWSGQPAGRAGAATSIAAVAFVDGPAIILAALARGWLVIDLLELILARVADIEVVGATVEAEAPGVAQPKRPNLRAGPGLVSERVV